MHELADVLALERYNLTRLVDRLEKEQLVQRVKVADDGRAALACITASGRELRQRMWQVYKQAVDELFLAEFDEEQREVFARALEKAMNNARQSDRN